LALSVVVVLAAGLVVSVVAPTPAVAAESLWQDEVPRTTSDPDRRSVELGVKFRAKLPGEVIGVRFYKGPDNVGPHTGSLWSSSGKRLARLDFTDETATGWQQAVFDRPVAVTPGRTYVVSYHAPRGGYADDQGYFDKSGRDTKYLAAPAGHRSPTGVYAYGEETRFPTQSWRSSNYYVDVLFKPGSPPVTTTVPPTTEPSVGDPTSTPPPSSEVTPPTTTGPGGGVLDLARVSWEGGPGYYDEFAVPKAAGWADPAFFPTTVWFESVLDQHDIDLDKGAGLNGYIELTSNSDPAVARANGMSIITGSKPDGYGTERVARLLADEADMWGGPGEGAWAGGYPGEGTICAVQGQSCGFSVMKTLLDSVTGAEGRLSYANYGKGVMFWQDDADAARFVNDYTTVVSNDVYWYTDPNVCTSSSEGAKYGINADNCRRAANYGLTMDRMRELDGKDGRRQPIFAFVEVGHPFSENSAPSITGPQVAGAVMNSLIHEARGIIYFNHSFGGDCLSQHVLRDPCGAAARASVTTVNQQIKQLAPVLNTQSYKHEFNAGLDTMLKAKDGSYYIFAMTSRDSAPDTYTLTLPPGMGGATAEVLFENRSVAVTGGVITDTFVEESGYHVYKITP
jgi:hypothetical protein